MEVINPDKLRFIEKNQNEYSVTAIEVSDGRSLEHFITIWFKPGDEDKLMQQKAAELWENPSDRSRHVPPIFHRDDHDSGWSPTRHHYHIPYKQQPMLADALALIHLINSVDEKYISPELQADITGGING
jgi:hypothetical protein